MCSLHFKWARWTRWCFTTASNSLLNVKRNGIQDIPQSEEGREWSHGEHYSSNHWRILMNDWHADIKLLRLTPKTFFITVNPHDKPVSSLRYRQAVRISIRSNAVCQSIWMHRFYFRTPWVSKGFLGRRLSYNLTEAGIYKRFWWIVGAKSIPISKPGHNGTRCPHP